MNLLLRRVCFQAICAMTHEAMPKAQQIANAARCSIGEGWLNMLLGHVVQKLKAKLPRPVVTTTSLTSLTRQSGENPRHV